MFRNPRRTSFSISPPGVFMRRYGSRASTRPEVSHLHSQKMDNRAIRMADSSVLRSDPEYFVQLVGLRGAIWFLPFLVMEAVCRALKYTG